MKKTIALAVTLTAFSAPLYAAKNTTLYNQPLASLSQFSLATNKTASHGLKAATKNENSLQKVNQTRVGQKQYTRYQQLYHGIPVIGKQVIIEHNNNMKTLSMADNQAKVSGVVAEGITLNTKAAITADDALHQAKLAYSPGHTKSLNLKESSTKVAKQIRFVNKEAKLYYLVSFRVNNAGQPPQWPHFLIDANTGKITKQWDNIQNNGISGPGGNEKVGEYWYGQDGLPTLDVTRDDGICTMDNYRVRLINLHQQQDRFNFIKKPYKFACDKQPDDAINGAFSPADDAYYFGGVIIDMYQQWYGLNALQEEDGSPMKLVMRVHYDNAYDNAFWDGKTMNFGDGKDFYPLVSLDVASHEVSHGFTQHHANLEYHDQSGSLNESFSDMAGQAARQYLLDTHPSLYKASYAGKEEVTWGVGETIMKDGMGEAPRYMDKPSKDGHSADCYDKDLAKQAGDSCKISYQDVVDYANNKYPFEPLYAQSYIVHTGSGIFNRAFYLLAKKAGIKKTFELMSHANIKYWTADSDFETAACGVLHAANDLHQDTKKVSAVLHQVGIAADHCLASVSEPDETKV